MSSEHTKNWPDLAFGLYERLTGSDAEIAYTFQKMHVQIPSGTGADAEHAEWVFDGVVKISTEKKGSSPK